MTYVDQVRWPDLDGEMENNGVQIVIYLIYTVTVVEVLHKRPTLVEDRRPTTTDERLTNGPMGMQVRPPYFMIHTLRTPRNENAHVF